MMNRRRILHHSFLLLFCFVLPAQSNSKIAIIIDDLGFNYQKGLRTIQLRGNVSCSFLPYTPYGVKLAQKAHQLNKEIILHLPMEAMGKNTNDLGALTTKLPFSIFYKTLYDDLFNIPYISGINNHKGSRLTGNHVRMQWLMRELSQLGNIFFVDSYTHFSSIAYQTAQSYGVNSTRRDIFLDNTKTPEAIQHQWDKLIIIAKEKGQALAIGHPYTETLDILEKNLPLLEQQKIQLITVNQLIKLQQRQQK
jgi:uncharacterized protein